MSSSVDVPTFSHNEYKWRLCFRLSWKPTTLRRPAAGTGACATLPRARSCWRSRSKTAGLPQTLGLLCSSSRCSTPTPSSAI